MEKTKISRKRLTLKDRLDILHGLSSGETAISLAKKYGVNDSTISKIKKHQENVTASAVTAGNTPDILNRKRKPFQSELDHALYSWFQQKRNRGDPISGPILKEKALELNAAMQGPSTFVASNGFLTRFKNRYGIHHISVQGEKMSADQAASDDFCSKFNEQMLAEGYTADQIYNADESDLWWKTMPRVTYVNRDESRADGNKIAKDRVTIMVCANASGTHQVPLFVIGKSAKPRCFKNIKELPVKYSGQKSAWMDKATFLQWYTEVFLPEIEKKHRGSAGKCILLLDNAPTHPSTDVLNSLSDSCKVVYMPPNVTSLIQPMDQGVIAKLKKLYRKCFLREFLFLEQSEQTLPEFLKGWDILKCCRIVAEAWKGLTILNLRNAWRKVLPSFVVSSDESVDDVAIDNMTLRRMMESSRCFAGITELEITQWTEQDSTDHGWPLHTNEQFLNPDDDIEDVSDGDDDDENSTVNDDNNTTDSTPSAGHALQLLDKYIEWFQTRWDFTTEDCEKMRWFREITAREALSEKFPNL